MRSLLVVFYSWIRGIVVGRLRKDSCGLGVVHVKRGNQVSNLGEKKFYKFLSDFRRIEMLFSKLDAFLLRSSWTVSLKGLAVRFRDDSGG